MPRAARRPRLLLGEDVDDAGGGDEQCSCDGEGLDEHSHLHSSYASVQGWIAGLANFHATRQKRIARITRTWSPKRTIYKRSPPGSW